ncbi:hypothetical protein AAHC03_09241 [Spirometra sp. Aus1]
MLMSFFQIFIYVVCAVVAKEDTLCGNFDGTFKKTTEPQTLTLYTDFVPSNITIGGLNIHLRENDCASENRTYACRLIQVHESGFWRFEVDDIVTANVDSVEITAYSSHVPPISVQALPLTDRKEDKIFAQSSAPFVLCPKPQQKDVVVDFAFPTSILDRSVKVSFYMDGRIQYEIGQNSVRTNENAVHDGTGVMLRVSFYVTRFQAPNKRYRTVSAVVDQGSTTTKILTKIVDFGSTVWDPICDTYDGTFSFSENLTNIKAYLPFKPQKIVIGHNYTFANNVCESDNEVLQCKLTRVSGPKIFKFEILGVSKRDIETIHFSTSDAKGPNIYILYRKMLTNLPQFMFSPEFSQPFGLRVLDGNTVLCDARYAGNPKCHTKVRQGRTTVRERLYKTPTTERFVFLTCELEVGNQRGYMTHLIDFGRKDAFEIGKEDIDETWSHLGFIYNGTYQPNSSADHFYAFMDFRPKYFRWFYRMDGENCITSIHSFACKIRKVVGSSFWRVEIRSTDALTANELSFQDEKYYPTRQYVMHSTPFSETAKGGFILNLSQPFVHSAVSRSTVSIKCAFRRENDSQRIRFKVYSDYRTLCGIGHLDLPPCKNVVFDTKMGETSMRSVMDCSLASPRKWRIFTIWLILGQQCSCFNFVWRRTSK